LLSLATALTLTGAVLGAVTEPMLTLAAVASGVGVTIGWLISLNAGPSPVGPALAWSSAAVMITVIADEVAASQPWTNGLWPLNLVGVLALLSVFPDGLAPGRVWRAVPWMFILAAVGIQVLLWGTAREHGRVAGPDPAPWRQFVGVTSILLLGLTLLLAVASLAVRYRRGDQRTRRQIRWLMLAGIAVVVLLIGGWGLQALGSTLDVAFTPFILGIIVLVPAAVGVAIVRYDLFDIDRILGATVTWIITATISAGIFALVVFLVDQAFILGGGPRNSIAAFVAALAFLPSQRFIADRVGRLVDRDRFVALEEVSRFASDVRAGRRRPEEIESVLRRVQLDQELTVQVKTPAGTWSTLDGAEIAQPSGFALRAGDDVIAMIRLGWDSRRARRRLADIAKAAWVPIEVSRLQLGMRAALEQVRESRTRLAVATAEERRRLERDLHDRTQQRIVASAMSLKLLQERLAPAEASELEATVRELKETVDELRRIAHGVRPRQLDDGLEPALAAMKETCPLPIDLAVQEHPTVSDAQRLTAYLVVNEAIVNVLKHADASRITIRVGPRGGRLAVEVSDDGVGGVPPDARLPALRDRVLSVGGSLKLSSPPGVGTTVAAVL